MAPTTRPPRLRTALRATKQLTAKAMLLKSVLAHTLAHLGAKPLVRKQRRAALGSRGLPQGAAQRTDPRVDLVPDSPKLDRLKGGHEPSDTLALPSPAPRAAAVAAKLFDDRFLQSARIGADDGFRPSLTPVMPGVVDTGAAVPLAATAPAAASATALAPRPQPASPPSRAVVGSPPLPLCCGAPSPLPPPPSLEEWFGIVVEDHDAVSGELWGLESDWADTPVC